MQSNFFHIKGALHSMQSLTSQVHRRLRPSDAGPIGIEFSRERLYMVQMGQDARGAYIRGAAAQKLPVDRDTLFADAARLKSSLRVALSHKAFKGRRVVTCLPPDRLKLILLSYRVAEGGNEGAAVMEQAMSRVEGDPRDWVVDYMPLRADDRQGGTQTALAALAQGEIVANYLEMLRAAGLYVQALEISPVAIKRLVCAVQQEQDKLKNILVVNLGQRKAYISVLLGRRLILDRDVDFGERLLIGKLAQVLEMEPHQAREMLYRYGVSSATDIGSDAGIMETKTQIASTVAEILKPEFRRLADELGKVLIYVASQSRGSSIDFVYLLGGIARLPGVEEQFGRLLELPVQVMQPLKQFRIGAMADVDAAEQIAGAGFAVAAGCALREVQAHD